MSVITDLIDENSSCHARIAELEARIVGLESQYQRDVWGLNNEGDPIGGEPAGGYANDDARLRAELAAIKAQGVVQWPEADEIMQMAFEEGQPADDASGYCFELEEFDLFIERLMSEVARLNAAPVRKVSVPDGATLILGDTGRKDLDRLIDRLMSSDPDFEDCTAAAALLWRLFMEEISGPKGHATWKDAAVAERLRRVSMRPSETVVAMAREGLAVYSGPNMNEHKVCAEIVRLADISDTAMLAAAPAAPAADAPPENCRQRLAAEGKPYPRSSCAVCGKFSPKLRECDAALAAHRSTGVV